MQTMKKRIVVCFLALCLCIAVIPYRVIYAADNSEKCGDKLTWSYDGVDTLTISGTGPMYDFEMDTENIGSGKPQRPWRNIEKINKVIISEGVTSIGACAFFSRSDVESVTIPNTVKSIGDYAFFTCDLTNITIPDSVNSIGESAFYGNDLKNITIPGSVKTLGYGVFERCSNLTSATFQEGVTSIGDAVFLDCYKLREVSLPTGLKTIGSISFEDCKSLKSVVIPEGVTEIEWRAFDCCASLSNVVFPSTLKTIGGEAFNNCVSLTNVDLPNSLTSVGDSAFFCCKNLSSVTIPGSVEKISSSSFCSCTNLTDIVILDGVKILDNCAFSDCAKISNVTIPKSVTTISDSFEYTIPDVYYAGTEGDWKKIKYVPDATRVHYVNSITLNKVVNGKATLSKNFGSDGDEITISIAADPCYELDAIKVNGTPIVGTSFNMPNTDVTVEVTFKEKQHTLTPVEGKPSNCEEDGYEAYYKCTECGKLFSDNEGKNGINTPIVINKLGHKILEISEKAPTKSEPGNIAYFECERCHKLFKDAEGKKTITLEQTVIPVMTHDLTLIKAKAATCTETGNIEYYKCEDPDCNCGKLYSDKYGQHEISVEDAIVPALKHDLKEIDAKAATCTEDGYEKYYKCSRCNKLFSDPEGKNEITEPVVVSKLGHDLKKVDAVNETYLKDGNIEYYICKRCGKKFADEEGKTELSDAEIIISKKGAAVLGETAEAGYFSFRVTNPATDGTGTVSLNGVADLTPNVSIPATVEIKEVTYKVTRIESNAFNDNKTIRTLFIGTNVVTIDAKAFYGCSNLTKVSGGAGLKTIGSYAFAKCPKLSSIKLSSNVLAKIGTYAFSGDKKLKTLYIKYTTKLTKSGVKKSLKGSKIKTVKVKKSKVKAYKKYFSKKNCGRKVKVKK